MNTANFNRMNDALIMNTTFIYDVIQTYNTYYSHQLSVEYHIKVILMYNR